MKSVVKTALVFSLLIIGCASSSFLSAGQEQQAGALAQRPGQPRFRIGVYWEGWQINDKNLESFFGQSQKNPFGVEASVHTLYNIDVWATYRAYSEETTTSFYLNTDKFKIKATSIGVVYRPIVWKMIEPFVGAGIEIYSYSETIEGQTDLPNTSGNATGFHFQLGTYINFWKYLSGKLFFRVNSVKDKLDFAMPNGASELDLGGKEFGVGLVVCF